MTITAYISEATMDAAQSMFEESTIVACIAAVAALADQIANEDTPATYSVAEIEQAKRLCDGLLALIGAGEVIVADYIEECPECGHREMSDGYGCNDCPECCEAMKVHEV